MSAKGSWSFYNLRSFLELIHRYRASSSNVSHSCGSSSTVSRIGQGLSMHHQGLQLIVASSNKWRQSHFNMTESDKAVPPPVSNPPGSNFPTWAKWILGSILSIILPFWKRKREELKRLEGEAEIIVEEVGHVAEVVEKVAAVAEKVSEEVAEVLPENGKLKETALLIEQVSKAAAHDAKLTQDIIHKVDALKHDIDDLKMMVDPVMEKIEQKISQGK
ncbi:Chemoreceptor [Salix suchowensis]|nr:Chemoreceptor [Salix suchowensis]